MSLLLLFVGAQATSTPPPAAQVTPGWIPHYETPEEAEIRWLKSHGKYFEPLEKEVEAKVAKTKSKSRRRALNEISGAIYEVADVALSPAEVAQLTELINSALRAKQANDLAERARAAVLMANEMRARAEAEDEDEAITLLLLS